MMRSSLRMVLDSGASGGEVSHDSSDDRLFDAYSRAVMGAAESVSPAVVNIEVAQTAKADAGNSQSPDSPSGSGSGFIIAPER